QRGRAVLGDVVSRESGAGPAAAPASRPGARAEEPAQPRRGLLGPDRCDAEGGLPADLASQARVHGARAADLGGARAAGAQARNAVVRLQPRRLARRARAGGAGGGARRIFRDRGEAGARTAHGRRHEHRGATPRRRAGGIGRMRRWLVLLLLVVAPPLAAQPAGLPTRDGLPTLA